MLEGFLLRQKICNPEAARMIALKYEQMMRNTANNIQNQCYVTRKDFHSSSCGCSDPQLLAELSTLSLELEKFQNTEITKWNDWLESDREKIIQLETKFENKLAQNVHDAVLDLAREKVHFREGHVAQTMEVQDLFTQIDTETESIQVGTYKLMTNMFYGVTSALGLISGFLVAYTRFMSF